MEEGLGLGCHFNSPSQLASTSVLMLLMAAHIICSEHLCYLKEVGWDVLIARIIHSNKNTTWTQLKVSTCWYYCSACNLELIVFLSEIKMIFLTSVSKLLSYWIILVPVYGSVNTPLLLFMVCEYGGVWHFTATLLPAHFPTYSLFCCSFLLPMLILH